MPVKNRFAEMLPEIKAWRHDFHRHPEVMYDLPRTSARVAELLREFGVDEIAEGIGRSGVVAVVRGKSDSKGRVIGLRADMDALPITEETGAAHASQVPGKMHACGHDGHTSMLLAAAKYLAETRNFDGTAVMIFQPAEEGGAGAKAMLDNGLLARWGIEEFYGLHNLPGMPVGAFGLRAGAVMAAADQFDIHLKGKGGHAAAPHQTVDTALVAAQVIVALQSIVSRNVDPLLNAVVSVCVIETDAKAYNVLPENVRLKGTARSLDAGVRALLERRIGEIAAGVAATYGAEARVDFHRGYPVTINDGDAAGHAGAVAEAVAGAVDWSVEPLMAGEDFSYMLNERPGAYIFLGNGDSAMLHHPAYDFNDEALPVGASWLAGMVEARMPAA